MYHFTDGGLRNVWLRNGYTIRSTPYGKAVSFEDIDGLTKTICTALAQKHGKLTGAEFRYLRLHMLMSQKALGQLLGYTEQAVAKWEKTGKIPKAIDLIVRKIFIEKIAGNVKISSTIDTLNLIERAASNRIILSEKQHKWRAEVEEDDGELEAA